MGSTRGPHHEADERGALRGPAPAHGRSHRDPGRAGGGRTRQGDARPARAGRHGGRPAPPLRAVAAGFPGLPRRALADRLRQDDLAAVHRGGDDRPPGPAAHRHACSRSAPASATRRRSWRGWRAGCGASRWSRSWRSRPRRAWRGSGVANVDIRVGDGSRGWAEHAPFDKILVAAAAEVVPPALVEQLRPGGRMVLPLGGEEAQALTVLDKDDRGPGHAAGSSSRCASAGWRRWRDPHVRARAESSPALVRRQTVELRRHDEVVLVQTFDLLGLQRDRGIAPAEGDVGMMALGLGELARPLDEAERLAEVLEPVGALDLPAIVEQIPVRRLRQVALVLPRWSAAVCRRGTVCSSSRQGCWACCSPRS